MVTRLAALFGFRDPLTKAAFKSDRGRFAELFAETTVYLVCVPDRFAAGLPADATREQILAQIRDAAEDLAERQDFPPFIYDDGGRRRLPLFTDDALASGFAQWYALRTRRIVPLQMVGVRGGAIVPAFRDCDVVALNDRSKHEYVLTEDDVGRLLSRTA
jgi:hypothetical protein